MFNPEIHDPIIENGEQVGYSRKLDLSSAKRFKKEEIKREAAKRIASTDWKVDRVKERVKLGKKTDAEEIAVYQEREDIRNASDTAESAVDALDSLEAVKGFAW